MKASIKSPREICDNFQLRQEFKKHIVHYGNLSQKGMLVFDYTDMVKNNLCTKNKDAVEIERQLWGTVKFCISNEEHKPLLSLMFGFSDAFINFLGGLKDLDLIDRLVCTDNFVSFALPISTQKDILDELSGLKLPSFVNAAITENNKFAFALVSALQKSIVVSVSETQLGLLPKLGAYIRDLSSAKVLDVFSHHSIEFRLRFDEETAINIMMAQDEESLRRFQEMKQIQILTNYIQNKDK